MTDAQWKGTICETSTNNIVTALLTRANEYWGVAIIQNNNNNKNGINNINNITKTGGYNLHCIQSFNKCQQTVLVAKAMWPIVLLDARAESRTVPQTNLLGDWLPQAQP